MVRSDGGGKAPVGDTDTEMNATSGRVRDELVESLCERLVTTEIS